jgi:hypothetical protein
VTRSMLVERRMLPSRCAAAILLRRFFLRAVTGLSQHDFSCVAADLRTVCASPLQRSATQQRHTNSTT